MSESDLEDEGDDIEMADVAREPLVADGSNKVILNYEMWPGANTVCCSGRCMMGADHGTFCCTNLLVIGNAVLFLYYVALPIHPAVAAIGALILAATVAVLWAATFTEAGIIPRQRRVPEELKEKDGEGPSVVVNGVSVQLKWCSTCNVWRPPKSKHCRDCDLCVEEFDHHCPWVCNCVGKRNYRFFVGFLIGVCALDVWVFFWCIYLLSAEAASSNIADAVGKYPVAAVEIVVAFIFGWCLCSLAGFHCYLVATNSTTNLQVQARRNHVPAYDDDDYQQCNCSAEACADWRPNCARVFCSPIPKSRINLRERYSGSPGSNPHIGLAGIPNVVFVRNAPSAPAQPAAGAGVQPGSNAASAGAGAGAAAGSGPAAAPAAAPASALPLPLPLPVAVGAPGPSSSVSVAPAAAASSAAAGTASGAGGADEPVQIVFHS